MHYAADAADAAIILPLRLIAIAYAMIVFAIDAASSLSFFRFSMLFHALLSLTCHIADTRRYMPLRYAAYAMLPSPAAFAFMPAPC